MFKNIEAVFNTKQRVEIALISTKQGWLISASILISTTIDKLKH